MTKSSALPLAVLLLAACGGGGPTPATPEPLGRVFPDEQLYYDNSGGFTDSLRLVVRNRARFEEVWTQATSEQPDPPAIPAVDFGESMVLLVSAGQMTPEDKIEVDSVGVREVLRADGTRQEVLTVVVRITEGCGRLQVDAYPVEIVRVPRFEGPVQFDERRVSSCTAPAPRPAAAPAARPDLLGSPRAGPAPPLPAPAG